MALDDILLEAEDKMIKTEDVVQHERVADHQLTAHDSVVRGSGDGLDQGAWCTLDHLCAWCAFCTGRSASTREVSGYAPPAFTCNSLPRR